MKIAFAGCSFTWGDELENPEEQRYSRLVCNKLEAEEINVSGCGWSNDILLHKFLKFCNSSEKPDVAVIQWTSTRRWQMWDDGKDDWEPLEPTKKYKLQWNAVRYYRHVYTQHHAIENYWKNVYLAEQYCKDNNIKLIMMELKSRELTVDYVSPYQCLVKSEIPTIKGSIIPVPKNKTPEWYEYWMENLHPSPKGHQLIADHIINNFQYFKVDAL